MEINDDTAILTEPPSEEKSITITAARLWRRKMVDTLNGLLILNEKAALAYAACEAQRDFLDRLDDAKLLRLYAVAKAAE